MPEQQVRRTIQSPSGRPGQGETASASDSGPPLRPGMRRTPAYSSSPTGAIRADWDQPTGDARSVRTRKQTEKVRQATQVNHNTKERTLYTCWIVLSGHVRRMLRNLPDMSEHEQCCGRRHLPYSVVGARKLLYQTSTVKPLACL